MYDLDFDLLPTIYRHRVFKGLPHDIVESLGALDMPETVDRLRGAAFFLDEVDAEKSPWLNHAHLRAGLSEFRSVAQALHWDLGRRKVHGPTESRNPLVHLAFRLRRLTVYVANVDTRETEVTATVSFGGQDHRVQISLLLIQGIERFLRREDLTHYSPEDVSRVCDWFDFVQHEYGAPQVLNIGIAQYCLELCDHYAGRRQVTEDDAER